MQKSGLLSLRRSEFTSGDLNPKSFENLLLSGRTIDYEHPPGEISVPPLLVECSTSVISRTAQDPDLCEYLFQVVVEEGTLRLSTPINDPIKGTPNSVFGFRGSRGRGREYDGRYIGTVHSHGDDSPPTYADLGVVLSKEDLFTIVVGSTRSYLIVATNLTDYIEGDAYDIWDERRFTEFTEMIYGIPLGLGKIDEGAIDGKIWEQTVSEAGRHCLRIYTSADLQRYGLTA